jgi:ABC-type multidrug transport system ATPase subunit
LSTIRQADKILVFDNGRIIESGSHFELMELNGVYSQLVLAQEISQEENVIDDEILDNESSELSRRLRDSMVSIKSPLTISEPDLDEYDFKLESEYRELSQKANFAVLWLE